MTPDQKYREIARSLGLQVQRCTKRERCSTFTGKTIQPDIGSQWLGDIAHELGHAFAADPERRRVREWGLGASYELFAPGPILVSEDEAIAEEEVASLIGILLQRVIEGHAESDWTWKDHSWAGEWRRALSVLRTPRGRAALCEMRNAVAAVT